MDTLTHMKSMMTSLGPLVGLVAVWLLGMPIFAYQHNRRGRPETDRVSKAGGSVLLGRWLMEYGYWVMRAPARLFVGLGIRPDVITILGLIVVSAGSAAVGFGHFGLGGWLILFGSILDAIVDRYCEIAGYIGLCYYYNERPFAMAAVLGALLGSLMVSYGRAKAEALGITDA